MHRRIACLADILPVCSSTDILAALGGALAESDPADENNTAVDENICDLGDVVASPSNGVSRLAGRPGTLGVVRDEPNIHKEEEIVQNECGCNEREHEKSCLTID